MQKNYSSQLNEVINVSGNERDPGPRQVTVSLLKQFARIYSYNQSVQPLLRSFIPN